MNTFKTVRWYIGVQVLFPALKPLIPQRFQGFSLCLEMSIDDDFPPWIAHDLADDFRRENMPRIKLKRVDGISRKLVSDAYSSFMRHAETIFVFIKEEDHELHI